jgi:hypothetical protein
MARTRILFVVVAVLTVVQAYGLSDSQCNAFLTKSTKTAKQVKGNCAKWGSCKAARKCTATSCTVFSKGGTKSQTILRNLQIQSAKYSKACKPKFKKSLENIIKLSSSTFRYCVNLYKSACTAGPADYCGACTLTCQLRCNSCRIYGNCSRDFLYSGLCIYCPGKSPYCSC